MLETLIIYFDPTTSDEHTGKNGATYTHNLLLISPADSNVKLKMF